jgi:hypothetical protein
MADQHNSNIPALGNQISADIPDIKENLEFDRDIFENFVNSYSATDATGIYPAYWNRTDIATADSPYTMLAADIIIEVDASGGAVEIDLLDATAYAKRYCIIKLVDATSALTLDPSGAQTIDGASSLVMSTANHCIMLYSDGSNWQVVFNNVLKNDTYLQASNAAGDGTVNLIKATPADQLQFGEQSSVILAEQVSTVVGDTHTTTTIDSITSTAAINVGMTITGAGIQAGTTVETIASATSITISQAATASTADVTFTLKNPTAADQIGLYARKYHNQSEFCVREESNGDEILMTKNGVPWLPSGIILPYAASTAPTGWLECDGGDTSMTTYEDLYDVIGNDYGLNTGAVTTFDNATETATSNGHGLTENDVIEVSNSGGALPTGLTANTKYYAVTVTTNTFQLATSADGSATPFSDDGSGTTRFHSEMKVPDIRGTFIRGWDHGATNDPDAATRTDRGDGTTGDYVGTKQADEVEAHTHGNSGAHTHTVRTTAIGNGTDRVQGTSAGSAANNIDVSAAALSTSHEHTSVGGNENRPVNINMMYIIKT